MKMSHFIIYLGLLLGLSTSSHLLAQDAAIVVDATQPIGDISPYVRGVNYGPLSAVPFDLMPMAEAAGITYMRFPGGRWGDLNNIQTYQIDQFIALARLMNAEPSISVRLEKGTPEQAAQLVRYTNLQKGYNVRYWSIGNEPNLFDNYTTIQHNDEWRAIATAMRAVDPNIILIGPDVSQYPGIESQNPKDPDGRDWMREFLTANGDMVDIVSIHRYPFPLGTGGRVTSIQDLRDNSAEWDIIIPFLRGVIQETTGRDIPIAVTEVNSHWSAVIGGEASPDSFYNAIWIGDVLGRLIEQQVSIVAYFDLQSSDNRGGFGLFSRYAARPSYYTYQMYQRFGSQLLQADSTLEYVSAYAAQREDGAITLILINMDDTTVTSGVNIIGASWPATVEYWLFDAEHLAEYQNDQIWDEEPTLNLPPQSISLYIIQRPEGE